MPKRIRRWLGLDKKVDAESTEFALNQARTHEAYRKIIQRLRHFRSKESGTVVLVATAVHREGGSSVAQQIASSLVQAEQGNVLLVDANLRSPSQHEFFGVQMSPGLVDVTAGNPEVERAVLASSEGGFALLPAGQASDDPDQFMRESILAPALAELRKSFDWIVMDGPPVTIYAEASTLCSLADATILVIRAESTRAEVADHAKRTIMESGGHLVGAILNRRAFHIPDFIYRQL